MLGHVRNLAVTAARSAITSTGRGPHKFVAHFRDIPTSTEVMSTTTDTTKEFA
jgi:hypothetical protein